MKNNKAKYQKGTLKQRQENAKQKKRNTIPIEIPQPLEDTWSPCASSRRGVKLLISTICAFCRILKAADFIGAYLQAKIILPFILLPRICQIFWSPTPCLFRQILEHRIL